MSFKAFLIVVYSVSGLLIASFSAFMTYVIIGEPIGMKMLSKIALSVLMAMPVIALISYLIGKHFYSKFMAITERLNSVSNGDFKRHTSDEKIDELQHIHNSINQLALQLSTVIINLKEKNREIANMTVSFAHDVKTPLMIIDGYIEELQDGLSDTSTVLEKIRKESGYINELSSDLLEYVGSLKSERQQETIFIKKYIEDCKTLIEFHPDVQCRVEIEKDVSIRFNPIDFKKICINLLHNSSKFTVKGEILVLWDGEAVIIQDTGTGIDPNVFDEVLDPFITADSSKNRQKSGLGIGLNIARNLARRNGYELYCDRHYTTGTKIYISPDKK